MISDINSFAASSSNDVGSAGPGNPKAHYIRIEGYSVLGSLSVSIKRSLKERFTDFAKSVRTAMGLK